MGLVGVSMQGNWVGQSEMTLTGPVMMEMECQWMRVARAVRRK